MSWTVTYVYKELAAENGNAAKGLSEIYSAWNLLQIAGPEKPMVCLLNSGHLWGSQLTDPHNVIF